MRFGGRVHVLAVELDVQEYLAGVFRFREHFRRLLGPRSPIPVDERRLPAGLSERVEVDIANPLGVCRGRHRHILAGARSQARQFRVLAQEFPNALLLIVADQRAVLSVFYFVSRFETGRHVDVPRHEVGIEPIVLRHLKELVEEDDILIEPSL